MKYIKCKECLKVWYVNNYDIDSVTTCPFCSRIIREKKKILEMDTLGKIIYKALSDRGMDMLASPNRLSGYLLDVAPDLKREIRIFSKTFDENYLNLYRNAFDMNLTEAETVIKQLRYQFIHEEGLSETWADMLCENCLTAIKYSKGEGFPEIISAEIIDMEFVAPTEEDDNQTSEIKKDVLVTSEYQDHTIPVNQNHINQSIGKPDEAFQIGEKYEKAGDKENALIFYRRSHYLPAYSRVANLYLEKENLKKAWRWYIKAAEQGDAIGLYFAGYFFQHGIYVTQNSVQAVAYYEKAAKKGLPEAWMALGGCYQTGTGVEIDKKKAADCFEKAGKKGVFETQHRFGSGGNKEGKRKKQDRDFTTSQSQKMESQKQKDAQKKQQYETNASFAQMLFDLFKKR